MYEIRIAEALLHDQAFAELVERIAITSREELKPKIKAPVFSARGLQEITSFVTSSFKKGL